MLVPASDGQLPSPAVLAWARRDHHEAAVIEDGGRTWSWRSLAAAAADVARSLPSVTGQPVALTAPNGGGFAAVLLGIWLSGGVPALVSSRLPPAERAKVLASVGPAVTVATEGLGLAVDVSFDVNRLAGVPLAENLAITVPRSGPQAPGLILFTSGTTGVPKPVVRTYREVWGLIDSVTRKPVDPDRPSPPPKGPPMRVDSRPMVHSGAIYGLLSALWRGRAIVIMERFDPVRYAQLVRDWEVETLNLVPTMVRMLLDAGDSVGRLSPPATIASSGTAALPDKWRTEFEARFGVPVQLSYGSTEVGTVALEPVADLRSGTRRPGSTGRVLPQVQVQVRDEQGKPVATGSSGAIWVRGEAISPQRGDAENQVPADSWIDTGDVGRLDDDRYLYIEGRSRDLIIRGGLKMVPAEIESVLLEHPQVAEAVVAGAPDPRLGEVPVAWVRTSDGDPVTGLQQFVRERLSAYKVPVVIHTVAEFPRTDNGKVRKDDLLRGLT